MNIPFIDLKAQYQALRLQIQEHMNCLLENDLYIMSPDLLLEDKQRISLLSVSVTNS